MMKSSEMIGRKSIKADVSFPCLVDTYLVKAGNYEAGTILELNTTENYLEPLKANGIPHSILIESKILTTNGNAVVNLTGVYSGTELVLAEGLDIASFKEKLREKSIFIR